MWCGSFFERTAEPANYGNIVKKFLYIITILKVRYIELELTQNLRGQQASDMLASPSPIFVCASLSQNQVRKQ